MSSPLTFLLEVLAVLVLPAIAVATAVITITGVRSFTRPLCAACRAALPFAAFAEAAACPGCGHTIDEVRETVGPPLPARRRHWVIGLLVIVVAIGGSITSLFGSFALRRQSQTFVFGNATRSSLPALLALAAKATHEYDPNLLELDRRVRSGRVSLDELREELLKQLAPGQATALIATVGLREIAAMVLDDPAVDQSTLETLFSAAWSPPSLVSNALLEAPPRIAVTIDPWERFDAPLSRWIVLRGVEIDGRRVPFAKSGRAEADSAVLLVLGDGASRPADLVCPPLAPGQHTAKVTLELRLVPGALARLAWSANDGQDVAEWTDAILSKDVTLTTTVDVPARPPTAP